MWKDSIDLAPLVYRKEGFWGSSLLKTGVKELGQNVSKELGQNLTKELGQSVSKELGQNLTKELGQSLTKELGQNLTKELGQSVSKELGQNLTKELGQGVGKEVTQSATNSSLKKLLAMGAVGGALYGSSQIRTEDTNGDGVIDEKDDSLLTKGAGAVGSAVGEVAGAVSKPLVDATTEIGKSLLKAMGVDPEKLGEYWDTFVKYLTYAIYFIIFMVIIKILSTMTNAGRLVAGRGSRLE